jgi:hypothetical protein
MLSLGTSQIMSVFCIVAGMGVIIAQVDQAEFRTSSSGFRTHAADAALPSAQPANPFRTVPSSQAPAGVVKTITDSDKPAKPDTPVVVAAPPDQTGDAATADPRRALELRRLRAIQEKAQAEGKRVFSRVNPLLRSNPGMFDAPPPAKAKRPVGTSDGANRSSDKLSRISSEEPESTDRVVQKVPVTSPGSVKLTTGSVPPQKSAAVTPNDTEADTPLPSKRVAKPPDVTPKVRRHESRRARSWRRSRSARREGLRKHRYNPAAGRPKAWDLP